MLQFWVDSHTGKTEVKVDDSGQGYLGWGFPCQSVPLPECARVCMQCVLECGGTLSVHAVCAGVWIASRQRDSDLPGIDRQPEPPSLRKKRLLRQQRVEESLHSRTRARQLLLSSEKSSSLLRIPIPPSGIPAPSPSNSCDCAETVV